MERQAVPIAMASGIMPEATPIQLVEAAARAAFDYAGMWIEPDEWTDATTRDVTKALADSGIGLLDAEVIWIRPGPLDRSAFRIVEIGAELGARNILTVSIDPDRSATRDKLAELVAHGARLGIRVNLEFGLFTEVKTIEQASTILAEIADPAGGLLVDTLHWARSGGTLEAISAIPPAWISYAQLCDAPLSGADPADPKAIIEEAVDGRLPVGQGGLPVGAYIDRFPAGTPFAIEERSKALRDAWPDLNARAAAVARTTRAFLSSAATA